MKSNQQNLGTIKSSNLCTEIVEYTSKEETAVCNLASISLKACLDYKNYSDYSFKIYGKDINGELKYGELILIEADFNACKTTFSMKPYSSISADRDIEANQLKKVNESVYYYIFDVFNIAHNQPEKYTGYITIIK